MLEKTLFRENTSGKNMELLINWLQENATEYFTSFELENDGEYLLCKTDGGGIFKVHKNDARMWAILGNGTSYQGCDGGYGEMEYMLDFVVKTDNGIYIKRRNMYNRGGEILISKTVDGYTVMSFIYDGRQRCIICPDLNIFYYYGELYNNSNEYIKTTDSFTTFSPIVFGGDSYTENMLITPFSQYKDTPCILTDSDGQKYIYDGLCALKYEE